MRGRWMLLVFLVAVGCDGDDDGAKNPGGSGGSAGSAGTGGSTGRGGSAGGGTSGSAGSAGSSGANGAGGVAGSIGANGAGGVVGSTGASGTAGSAGGSGSDAGDAATDAPVGQQRAFVYIGGGDGTISIFRMDQSTGQLTPAGTAAGGTNPSFMAWDPAHRYLFAVNETSPGRVVAFSINPTTGALQRLNDESSAGNGPAHVSVDRGGRWVLVANYAFNAMGTVAVLPIGQDGRLGAAVDTEELGNNSLPHMIVTGPDNRNVYVPCKGRDIVAPFDFDAANGRIVLRPPPHVSLPTGAGPRHFAFHPSGRSAYLVGETNSTLTALGVSAANGALTALETESTLPAGFTGTNTGADVHVSPNGGFAYASNRGHNSIAIFSIDAQGRITSVGHQPTGGNTPRNFHIDPSGTFLLAANQGSGTVVVFRIGADGRLTNTGHSVNVNAPAFVGVVTQTS